MTTYQASWANGLVVRWRLLTWAEHRKFQVRFQTNSPMSVCNDIYRTCILQGPDIKEAMAGLVEFVAMFCYENSAFSGSFDTIQNKLAQARATIAENYLLNARAIIANLFKYTFEEIDRWDDETFLARLVMAETILGKSLEPISSAAVQETNKRKEETSKVSPMKKPLTPTQEEVIRRRRNGQ